MGRVIQARAYNKEEAKEYFKQQGRICGDVKVVVKSGRHSNIRKAFGEETGLYEAYVEGY